jgi:uncharacterized protein involved in outer membrane biogenesis
LIGVLGLAAILATLYLVLHFLVPMSRVERYIEREVGRKLHRELRIQGLRVGIFGVAAQEVRLSEVPNFNAGVLAEAQGITLHWGLRTLLKGMDIITLRPTQTAGSLRVDHLRQTHYQAEKLNVAWSLKHLEPSLRNVDGWIRLRQGPGLIRNLDSLIATSRPAKLALTPLLVIQNLEKTGIVRLGLPNLRTWPLSSVQGDYALEKGTLKIQTFLVASPVLSVGATGQIELPTNKLAVDVVLKSPGTRTSGPLDIQTRITGTLAQPKVDLKSLKKKAFQATIRDLLPALGL